MPIYEYRCEAGAHTIEHIHRFSDGERPAVLRCAEHGVDATYIVSLPGVGVVAGSANPVRRVTKPLHDTVSRGPRFTMAGFHCDSCNKDFDDVIDHTLNENADDGKPCPTCGVVARHVFGGARVDGMLKMYPRFSPTLGKTVDSHAEYLRELAARGLRIEEDGEHEAWQAARNADTRKQEAVYAEYTDMLENDPAYANFRKSRDQGFYDPKPGELERMAATVPELSAPMPITHHG